MAYSRQSPMELGKSYWLAGRHYNPFSRLLVDGSVNQMHYRFKLGYDRAMDNDMTAARISKEMIDNSGWTRCKDVVINAG